MPISHRVRQQHPELFTEAIVLHARQGDRGLSLADSGGLDIEEERGRCHIDAAATPRLSAETCAPARAGSPQIRDLRCVLPLDTPDAPVAENCNVNLDDLDQDRPDLNCEPLQAPGTARNLQLDETGWVGKGSVAVGKGAALLASSTQYVSGKSMHSLRTA